METAFAEPMITEPIDWEGPRRFHGHLGPWLALGMRVGSAGLLATGAKPHFGVQVEVRCRLRPPVSCMLDGLQWATGATYGKQNLLATEGTPFEVRLTNKATGTIAVYSIAEHAEATMRDWIRDLGEEHATHKAWAESEASLFARLA